MEHDHPKHHLLFLLCHVACDKKTQLFTEFSSCVKVELAVLGSPSLTVLTVSVDVKQH